VTGNPAARLVCVGQQLLVVFGVGVDLPGIPVLSQMFRAASSAAIIEWSWLLYLCMPLRPTVCRFWVADRNQSRMTATLVA
jgi:hypothetical protein